MTSSARPSAPSKTRTSVALGQLTAALEAFRAHREDASINLLVVFLAIARRKTISAAQIGAEARLSQSAISRSIIALGRGKAGEPGLRLVVQEIDPIEPRAHAIKLTAKGKALARQLAGCLGGAEEVPGGHLSQQESRCTKTVPWAFAGAHWEVWMD